MPETPQKHPRNAPEHPPCGWISERTLAQLYGLSQHKMRTILRRTGLAYREIRYYGENYAPFWRTYWPAHLHPAARPTSKPHPAPEP